MLTLATAARRACYLVLFTATAAHAATQRTFVASNGSDAYPCSLAQPCRSFATAIAKTDASGEVIVLDSAGYGPVTIAKSVSVVAPMGVYAGVTVTAGNGVTVNGANIKVRLRGLAINGQGGATGVFFQQGSELRIEDCAISNMADNGIDLRAPSSRTYVTATSVANSANTAVYADAFAGQVSVVLDGVRLEKQTWGVYVRQGAIATMRNSRVSGSSIGGFVVVDNGSASPLPIESRLVVDGSTFERNTAGMRAFTTVDNGIAHLDVVRSTVAHSEIGVEALGPSGLRFVTVVDSLVGNVTYGVRTSDLGSSASVSGNAFAGCLTGIQTVSGPGIATFSDNRFSSCVNSTEGAITPVGKE
jgi:hypothetical protein